MWEEWKTAYLLHKLAHRDPRRMGGYDVIRMAVANNAALARIFFPEALGELAADAYADIIFVDYHAFTPLTAENLPWHILFGFEPSMVTTTIVGGEVLNSRTADCSRWMKPRSRRKHARSRRRYGSDIRINSNE